MIAALRRLSWVLFGVLLAFTALSLLFTTFMVYDDEGYVLFSLKWFAEGGGLYERVYSQYGPFFFLFNQVLHLGGAGVPFTNVAARVLTGCYWLATAGLCSAIVWRSTRSAVAAWITLAGVFLHLWPMTSEPSHPGGLIIFLVALAAWVLVGLEGRPRWRWPLIGGIGAALCLTKINVGVFLVVGVGAWWALHLEDRLLARRIRVGLLAAGLGALPVLLMRQQLGIEWVATFAVLASASGVAVMLAAGRGATALTGPRQATEMLVAGAAVTLGTAGALLVQGTSFPGLLDGVILGPLRHPQRYLAPVNWRDGVVQLALGSLVLAVLATRWRTSGVAMAVAIGRLGALLWFSLSLVFDGVIHPHAFAMSYALPLTWLFVLPLGADAYTQPTRTWLALLLVPQALHAFPVAGSQISWGTFLWVPLAVIAGRDALQQLAGHWPHLRRVTQGLALALLAGLTARAALTTQIGLERLRQSDRLGLPGAETLLLPEGLSTALRILARNAVMHADTLFTMPGMLSFHLWTDLPPPTSLNTTHWFSLLNSEQQEAIRQRLAASPRSVVIVQRDILDFLIRQKISTESPLAKWLRENYEPAFSLHTYEFWVRKGRTIAAANTATVRESAGGTEPRYRISLVLAEAELRDISSFELGLLETDPGAHTVVWSAGNSRAVVTPLNSAGREAAAFQPQTFPFTTRGLVRIDLFTDRFPPKFPLGHAILLVRDSAGRRLAEARFID